MSQTLPSPWDSVLFSTYPAVNEAAEKHIDWVMKPALGRRSKQQNQENAVQKEDRDDNKENFPPVHDRRGHAPVVLEHVAYRAGQFFEAHSQSCRCLGRFGASAGLGQAAARTAIWIS